MSIQLINQIFMPSLASGACTMSDRGSPIAVPGVAAGGYNNTSSWLDTNHTLSAPTTLARVRIGYPIQTPCQHQQLTRARIGNPDFCTNYAGEDIINIQHPQ